MIHLHSRLLGDISKMLPSTQQVIRRRTLETHSRAADLDKMPVLAQPHAAGEIATAFDNMVCILIPGCARINANSDPWLLPVRGVCGKIRTSI